jgi:hypothetical protein
VFNAINTPYKRHRGTKQQNEGVYPDQNLQNLQNVPEQMNHDELVSGNSNQPQPSLAACRFAATRFPFSPFTVIFTQVVREKIVVDDLINHARNNSNFELKTVAYRRGEGEQSYHNTIRYFTFAI